MQLLLIAGIVFAIGAVLFALQNNVAVSVGFLLWRFDSTLALVLLIALGLGALIAALLSTPAMLRGQWGGARLRRQVEALEQEKARLEARLAALEAEAARLAPPAPEETRPFAELRQMLVGADPKKEAGPS